MSIIIRNATDKDSELLCSLISQSFYDVAEKFQLTPENCPTHPSFIKTERIKNDIQKGVEFFILEDNNKPAGCVGLEFKNNELCYLIRLAVLPGYRNNGLGKMLVFHCIEHARKKGLLRVEIAIIAAQESLRKWYEKLGFTFLWYKQFHHLPFNVAFLTLTIK